MHRDLKLENLLLASPQDITKVKIADFGLAKKAAESQMETICGTPQYVAPEVIQVAHQPGLPAIPLTWAADCDAASLDAPPFFSIAITPLCFRNPSQSSTLRCTGP